MISRLRILHLEDSSPDAELIASMLEAEGLACEIARATTRDDFMAALDRGPWDAIISDFSLPSFDGAAAQAIAKTRAPGVPFVFVSGTIGEEVAIERLKAGATDYVLKQRLTRLGPAMRRALQEARDRRERAAAEEANDFLEHLLAASPAVILRLDPSDLRATFVSANIGWLLGYAPEEVLAVPGFWEGIIHPDDRRRVIQHLNDAMDAAVVQIEQEYRCRTKDGRYRWFFNLLRLEYDELAAPAAILGYAIDISDRKAAEAQARDLNVFLDSIVDNLPNMVFVKDAADLRFVRFNRAGEALLGLDRAQVIGRTDYDVLPREIATRVTAVDRQTLAGTTVVDIPEEILTAVPGTVRILHTKKLPILDESGRPRYLLGISEDITERREAAEETRLAKLEAERANRAKSDFLSRMSHDLRTPLNAILGFAQILELDDLGQDQADSVRQILGGGRHLLELINEVLDISRIESGHISLSAESVRIAEVVNEVCDLIKPLASARRIRVRITAGAEAPSYVHADRQRLRQILLNLLSNGVKYNVEGGTVAISWSAAAGERVRLDVIDTGAGIPSEKLPLVFQPFERLGAEASSVEGTGLGLAVVKGLVQVMNGTVGVESEVDLGTTFWFELPRGVAPQDVPIAGCTSDIKAADADTDGTLLYIEDNQSNIRLLERIISKRRAVRLVTSTTGRDGLESARALRPDLILLDLHLPDMPGEEVLRHLWSDPSTRSLPVTVLSADATPNQRRRLLSSGAVAYLTKPIDVARLLELIDHHLSRAVAPRPQR